MSTRHEDRFPLLLINMGADPFAKVPEEALQSARDRNVTQGAATLLSRWPNHVSTTSRLALATALFMMFLSFFMVAVIYFTSDSISFSLGSRGGGGDDEPVRHPRRRIDSCDVEKDHGASMHDGADVDAMIKHMSPLSSALEFLANDEKIFFVMSQGDLLVPENKCAIDSAVRVNYKTTIYLLIFLDKSERFRGDLERRDIIEEEREFNNTVRIIYVNAENYFKVTPLEGFWHQKKSNKNVKELAAKLVTLWRFGGLALDVKVLSLTTPVMLHPKSKNANVDLDGYVLEVRQPCHSFMIQAMKVLAKIQHEEVHSGTQGYNAGAVVTVARDVYCKPAHCKNRVQGLQCHGIKILSKEVVCYLDNPNNKTCSWASFTDQDVEKDYFKEFCSFSSNFLLF